nr:MAG TPA: hypothetical protein [Caudoviricetes sp.]
MNTPTPNPWIRYADVLAIIERSTNNATKKKKSLKTNLYWFYWDGVQENCRVMGANLANLAVNTTQPPTAEMIEARTLARVLDYIDMLIENALSGPSQQVQTGKLWGLKTLRAELRKQQDNPLGG